MILSFSAAPESFLGNLFAILYTACAWNQRSIILTTSGFSASQCSPNYAIEHIKAILTILSGLSKLQRTENCKFSDPRDKIFALLSMIGGRDAEFRLTPDYSKSVIDVYIDTTIRYTEFRRFLDLLPTVEFHSQELPSWVPNWEVPRRTIPQANVGRRRKLCSVICGKYEKGGILDGAWGTICSRKWAVRGIL